MIFHMSYRSSRFIYKIIPSQDVSNVPGSDFLRHVSHMRRLSLSNASRCLETEVAVVDYQGFDNRPL